MIEWWILLWIKTIATSINEGLFLFCKIFIIYFSKFLFWDHFRNIIKIFFWWILGTVMMSLSGYAFPSFDFWRLMFEIIIIETLSRGYGQRNIRILIHSNWCLNWCFNGLNIIKYAFMLFCCANVFKPILLNWCDW